MDYFKQLAQKFPQPLDPDIQEQLLKEYYNSKNPDVREKLLEHNLLLCLKVARELCAKYDYKIEVDEMFSICYDELSNSLEKYNPYHQTQAKFYTYAYNNMKLYGSRIISEEYHQHTYQVDTVFMSGNDEHSLFEFFSDYDEGRIAELASSKSFIKDVIKYIETQKHGEIVKMYLGLGYPRKYKQPEIAKKFGVTKQDVSTKLTDCLLKVKYYIAQNYQSTLPDYAKGVVENQLTFETREDRDKYIFETLYGYNNAKQKDINTIAIEVNLNPLSIKKIIHDYKEKLSPEEKLEVSNCKPIKANQLRDEEIFNAYYGLGGLKMHEIHELEHKYGASTSNIYIIEKRFINNGKYTRSEINQFRQARDIAKKNLHMEKYAYMHFSYYGTNGHEKKSKNVLAKEFGLAPNSVLAYVQKYGKYLDSLSPENRSIELSKHLKQTETELE